MTLQGVGTIKILQSNTSSAVAAMEISQQDADEPFIKYTGTDGAPGTSNIADAATYITPGTLTKWIRVDVGGTDYWIPANTAPS